MPVTISWLSSETITQAEGGDSAEVVFETMILDGTVSRTADAEAAATEHTVEQGSDVTDHVKPQLRRLSMDVIISAHPGPTSDANADFTTSYGLRTAISPDERPAIVRETLERLCLFGIEVDIETPAGEWPSMLLLAVSETQNPETGDGYRATVTAREFKKVSTSEVDAPSPRVERTRRTADSGQQGATDTNAPQGLIDRLQNSGDDSYSSVFTDWARGG